jgi:formate hydrogenlyase transcriptional activator
VENSLSYSELSEMKERLATEKLYLEDEIRIDHNIGNMVGGSAAFQSVLKSVQIVAPTDSTVLILGETGTGKELVARAIHELSGRGKGTFVKSKLRGDPRQPARKRAIRAREGLIHRSGGAKARTV